MKRKFFSVVLSAAMVAALLGGCGNSESGTGTAGDEPASGDTSAGESTGDASGDASGEDVSDEDVAEINMVILCTSAIPNGLQDVEDAINKITESEINVHVNMELIESGSYEQQVGLKMSSSETTDLLLTMPMGSASFNNMASQNQFMDIGELLEEYGQGILDTVGELIEGTTVNGKVFGVTTYRTLVSSEYIVMRTDVLENLGLLEKAQNMTSLSEYEEILEAVKNSEEYGTLAGIVSSDGAGTCLALAGGYLGIDDFSEAGVYDQLGDLNKIIAINPDGSDDTIQNNFATEQYRAMFEKMHDWYEKGYVYKDVTTNKEQAEQLVKSNVAFSYFSQSEIGVEASKSAACGYDMTCVKIITLPISTSSCTKFVWGVPQSSAEPEAAVKFLNMMYTDSRIANLLAWGIEGTHYQVKDGVAYYMDGEDANNCAYHTADFLYGNQFLVLPWEGQSADFRELAQEEMDSAVRSKYLGFSCDTTGIQNEITSISNVLDEFLPAIDGGVSEPEVYDEFLAKLESSGAQVIVDEYQKQLDEWLAAGNGTDSGASDNAGSETADTDAADESSAE